MSRTIAIRAKHTQASTQYWQIESEDRAWLLGHLVPHLTHLVEQSHWQRDLRQAWYQPDQAWPRGRAGRNSAASFTAGVISQLWSGRDLTTAHLDAWPEIWSLVQAQDTQVPDIVWQRSIT